MCLIWIKKSLYECTKIMKQLDFISKKNMEFNSEKSSLINPIGHVVSPELPSKEDRIGEECCGWLWMRSSSFGRWKYRYFILRGNTLTYYEKFPSEEYFKQNSQYKQDLSHLHSDGSRPKGVLRVAHVEESESNRTGFKVFGKSGKLIQIRAAKANIRMLWLKSLKPTARDRARSWSNGSHVLPRTPGTSNGTSYDSFSSDNPVSSSAQLMQPRISIPVEKNGWLLKQSDVFKKWRKYFFVLQGNMLSYYATDKPYEVPRRRGYIKAVAKSKSARGGVLIELDSGNVLHVCSDDESESNDWYSTLQDLMPCHHFANESLLISSPISVTSAV